MTRKHDRQQKADKGKTTEQLLAAGYVRDTHSVSERLPCTYRMRQGTSVKTQCTSCQRWFDEVMDTYLDAHECWHCRRGEY